MGLQVFDPKSWAGRAAGLVFLAVVGVATAAVGQERVPGVTDADRALLRTLRPGHPRLIGLEEDLQRMREMIGRESLAQAWRDRLRNEAVKILGEPPVERVLVGPRLLGQSRRALDRIYTLALMYRLERDQRLAERARNELLAISAFQDWNPSHFLDVAEMTHAVAIGYDWLYDFLNARDRATIRRALANLGLKPSLEIYRQQWGWVRATHNWNQVCNGGMVLGALAIADEDPDLAAFILARALESVNRPLARFAPDGGWDEGPGYWNYATRYTVYLLAGLETALGTDFGLSQTPGFAETGVFRLHFSGPIGLRFNFADADEREQGAAHLFWLARRFNRPLYVWIERQITLPPHALDLLWFDSRGDSPKAEQMPTDVLFRGIDTAFFRSAWEDRNAVFVGMKGGDNRANHSHLDLGTFVLDAEGQRWAVDLGPDDYDLPGYFSKEQRFTYYRLTTAGHNTLTLDGENQSPNARAPILAFSSEPARAFAVTDLTAGYAGQAQTVWRGIALLERQHVLVQDEVEAAAAVEVLWGMHTRAEVQTDGARATLAQGNAYLYARVLEPSDARFDVVPANPPPPENQNPGVKKLIVRLPNKVTRARIVVLLSPTRSSSPPAYTPPIRPLSDWVSSARE